MRKNGKGVGFVKVISENLRRIRKEKGWTQEKLAERIHVDRTTYNKYESGKVDPPLDICIYLCVVLDTNPNELMGWGTPEP